MLVLGDLQLRRGGRAVALPPSRKTRALLGYLAVTGRPQPRQRLCDLLWDGPGDPRGALRWSLAKLRPLVDGAGRGLAADGDLVALELGPETLDLAALQRRLAGGAAAAPVDDLRAAAALFRGELLEGLDVADCFRFHEWCVAQREALRRQRLQLLDALVARLEADAPEEALAHARARVAVDPFSEAGHVAVLRLLGRLRRVREGLEQYDAFREVLASTFGARPSAELERARIALTAPPPARPPKAGRAAPAPRGAGPSALVGRDRERAALSAAVAATRDEGRRHAVLLLGEPGLGKTRLLDELAALAASAGFLALRARAYEAEALRPYGPWLDALRGAPLASLSATERAELAPLLPELGAPAAAAPLEQARLFDAVVRALAALAAPAPVLLALDDLHWLDDASAALLHYVFRAVDDAPVLLACAARPGELADRAAALRTARALRRAERVVRLELAPLGAAEVAALARGVDPSLDGARVWAESEGNPLLALAVSRALASGAGATGTLDALLQDRLTSAGGRARELLPWAAALGRSFGADRLARVSGLAPAELLAALDELERRGILRPSGVDGWDFAHDLLRSAAYASLSEPRRRLLHRGIARALAPLPDPDGAIAGEVARHAALGDDPPLAARAAAAAGARAVRLSALAEARDLVERGLAFAARLPDRERISASLALLRVGTDASRPVGGDPALPPRLEALVEEARRLDLPAEVAAGCTILSHAHFANRDLAQTAEAAGDALSALAAVPPGEAAAAMAEAAGCLVLLERDLPRARVLLDEARRAGPLGGRATAYLEAGAGLLFHLDGAVDRAAEALERAARLASRDVPWEEAGFLGRLALAELDLGRPERVAARVDRLRELAARQQDPGAALLAGALSVAAARGLGRPADPAALAAALAPLEVDSKLWFALVACRLAEHDLAAGDAAGAAALLRRARAAADAVNRASVATLSRALLAAAALRLGDRAGARVEVDAARRLLAPGATDARALAALEAAARALGVGATPLPGAEEEVA